MSTQEVKIRLSLDGAGQLKTGVDSAAASLEKLGQAGAKVGQQTQLSGQQIAQVSAQLQDLFIQIQGGQAPLTAVLQQGSQLSAVFGGVGNALRAVASLFSPVVVGLGAVGAAVGVAALAYAQGSAEADEFRRSIVLTGNAAGVTVGQLQDMARAQGALVGTQARAAEVFAALASSGAVAAGQLQAAADAAIRLERVGGPAAEETAKKFAKLGQDPVRAIVELNKAENFLTESVYKQVKALQEQGRVAEAAAVAQSSYAATISQRTTTLAANLGTLERAWEGVKDKAKGAWDAILNIGRPDSLGEKLEASAKKLVALENQLAEVEAGRARGTPGYTRETYAARLREKIEAERQNQAVLQESQRIEQRSATIERERAEAVRATIAAEEKSATAAKAAQREREQELQREAALIEKSIGLSGNYYKSLDDLNRARQRGSLTMEQYVAAVNDLTNAQPFAVKNNKELTDSLKGVADAEAAGIKLREQYIDGLLKGGDAAAKQVQQLRDEEAAAAIAATGNLSLAQAIQQVAIARLQEQQAAVGADTEAAEAIQKEIDARRELITLIGSGEARKAAADSAREAEREWVRASDRIEDSITNALMRGFESGKGFAENFRDTLVNIFKTEVLRPFISQLTRGMFGIGGLAGGLGLPGVANAANAANAADAGGLAGLGSLGSLAGLAGLSGQAGSIGSAIAAGFMNTVGGGTLAGGQAAGLLAGGAGTGTGFAGMLGAALPWVGGAVLIGNALGLFRSTKTVGSGITGNLGGSVEDFEVNRRGGTLFSGPKYSTPTIGVSSFNADLQKTFDALRQNAAGFAGALGLDAEAARRFVTPIGSEKLSDDTGGIGIRLEGLSAEEVSAKIQKELEAANDRLAQSVLGSAASAFAKSGETASQTLERLAGSLTGVNGVLDALGQAALQASAQGGAYASALLDLFGGLQQYQASAGQYLQDFYSEAERTALATRGLEQQLQALGLSVPSTREAYRQLVEAQDLSTEAGRKAYAALLQLAPGFAQLVPAIEAVTEVVDETARRMAEAGRRALEDLARDSDSLQVDLLRAQGNESGARALAREQALAAVRGSVTEADLAAITAAYDLNQAYRDQIDAARAAVEAQRAIEAAQKSAAEASQLAAEALQRTFDGLAGTRFDLENQILTQEGKAEEVLRRTRERDLAQLTAGLGSEDAARVAAAYDFNAALRRQIEETNKAQQAAQELADAQNRAAQDAQRAADQFRGAWQSITDTLFDEVARIRGLLGGGGADSLASAQARFAVTTAQARAGDQEAAKLLPGLSQTLLQFAEVNAASLIDLQRIRAQVAASLEQTGAGLAGRFGLTVPKFEVGTNYVPRDMLAMLHEGEAVVPRAFNPAAGGEGGSAALLTSLNAMREENKAQALAIVKLQMEVNRLLKKWDSDGIPEERKVVA